VGSRRFAYGVHVEAPGFIPSADAFGVEPGGRQTLTLHPRATHVPFTGCWLTAVNMTGRVSAERALEPGAGDHAGGDRAGEQAGETVAGDGHAAEAQARNGAHPPSAAGEVVR
jgi:hypothetical protein